ncbi:MAG: hypothetical protein K1X64_23595 [Myxococcaceae bacterium]|nr:hypothetical protein [Myxococcaceae bacterium]
MSFPSTRQGAGLPASVITSDDWLLFLVNGVGLVWAAIDAYFDWGPWSAWACVVITSVMYLGHVAWRGRDILKNLLVFGIAAGLTELAADGWLVKITKTLDYAKWGPFLIESPAYMPMSWAGILLSMGFLGWVVSQKHGMAMGTIVATVVSGIYVPTFEGLAHYAGWWTYDNCARWGVVPWYIIVGEALIGGAMPLLVSGVIAPIAGLLGWVARGVVAGLWIWAAYFIALSITG